MIKYLLAFLLLLWFNTPAFAQGDPEKTIVPLIYDGDVLEIPIATGEETRIIVGYPAKIGYDPSVASKTVSTKLLPSGIFISTNSPFDGDYGEIVSTDGTRVIPVRFVANDGVRNPPTRYRIIDRTVPVVQERKQVDRRAEFRATVSSVIPNSPGRRDGSNTIVDMVRFAAQSLYGAPRHRQVLSGVQQVDTDEDSYRLFSGASVKAKIIKSYRYGDLFVTSVKLENRLSKPYEVDPRTLVGHWRYAAFQTTNIIEPGDRGVLHLVSDKPFDHAFRTVVNWRKL